jgi:hypothetical protein
MRHLFVIPALAFGLQLGASEFQVVVRTSDVVIVTVTVRCPDDNSLVPVQYEERKSGSASWHVVGGVPPYRLVTDRTDRLGVVCFSVMDATGRQASGCGVINERRSERIEGCNGSRNEGQTEGTSASGLNQEAKVGAKAASVTKEDEPEGRPRISKYVGGRREPPGGRPPILREERLKEVDPPSPAPRPQPQQRDVGRNGGTPPPPSPRPRSNNY